MTAGVIRQLFQDSESGKFSVTDEDFSCTFTEKGNYAQSLKIQAEFDDLNTDEKVEPPRVSRRPNFLREYPNEKYLLT